MTPAADRRRRVRSPRPPPDVVAVRLRPGRSIALVDVSEGGVGLVTDTRIAPGAVVDVVVVGSSTRHVRRGTVVHSRVCALHPTDGARFRVGVSLPPAWPADQGRVDVSG